MKYYLFINDELKTANEDLQEVKDFVYNFINDNMTEDAYDESWDECYEEIKIGCCTFAPSTIMKKCDPIAYNCGWSEYCDYVAQDLNYMLELNGEDSWSEYDFDLLALPSEIELDIDDINLNNDTSEEISNYLSNEYNYCVNDFKYTINNDYDCINIYDIDWDVE